MTRTCTILFTDGESQSFQYEKQKDASVVAKFLKEGLDRNTLAIEVDGQLLVFPMANIRSITFDPAPSELPGIVIHGAKST